MNMEELNKVVMLLNEGDKYIDKDLTFERIEVEGYTIVFLEEFSENWDGEYTCDFLEIYEVYKNGEKIGHIGRMSGKSMYGMQWSSEFNVAVDELVLKHNWRLINE